ncbi:MAG: hypothetical protein IKX58_08450 [Clostridia bacterium]|nr:hypothetical protein [Clostridia bacterium]
MNRKKLIIIVTIALIAALSLTACSAENGTSQTRNKDKSDAYVFPEYTGSKPLYWEDDVAFYQIPDDVLKTMSTDGLIETCLSYPLFAEKMIASNESMYSGFLDTCEQFNGLAELLKREDSPQKLVEIYTQGNLGNIIPSDSHSILRTRYLEYTIAQDEILFRLSESERASLCKACIDRFESARKDNKDATALDSTLLIASKILAADNDDFKELVKECPGIDAFNHNGMLDAETAERLESIAGFID